MEIGEGRELPQPATGDSSTPDVKDPETGRSFDGHYDDLVPCGCVVFYHGGTVRCEKHR